jgi:hypothetical protein
MTDAVQVNGRRQQRLAWLIPVAACALLSASPALHAEADLDEILAALQAQGAQATLTRHFDCRAGDGSAYREIARGDARWVELAGRLMPAARGCYARGLQDALGQAMREAPRVVLPLVGRSAALAPAHICLPMLAAPWPVEKQLNELRASKTAITAVDSPRLHAARQACLNAIGRVESRLTAKAGATR